MADQARQDDNWSWIFKNKILNSMTLPANVNLARWTRQEFASFRKINFQEVVNVSLLPYLWMRIPKNRFHR